MKIIIILLTKRKFFIIVLECVIIISYLNTVTIKKIYDDVVFDNTEVAISGTIVKKYENDQQNYKKYLIKINLINKNCKYKNLYMYVYDKDININLDEYDTIILGTPVWWYRPCPAIRAFLTKYDLSNKTIIPFATNAGWLGRTFKEIEKLANKSTIKSEKNIVFESYSSNLKTNKQEIESWIETLK